MTALKLLALDRDFGNSSDEMVRDKLVSGVQSNRIREKLLSEGRALTVKAAETSQAIKAVGETHVQMKNEPSTVAINQEVEAICQQKALQKTRTSSYYL